MAQLSCIAVENACLMQEVSQLNAGLEKKVARRTAALARQEALFRALAEQAPQIIWTTDQQGEAIYLNHAWFSLMGCKLEDWTGTQWMAVLHPEDTTGLQQNWALARASEQPFSGVRRWLCQDGSVHTMAYRASPVRDEQGQVSFWVGIDADVTEFKLIEGALRRSNEELEAFSYSVSHDLRAPLSTINGFGSLLDEALLRVVMENPLGNAWKFSVLQAEARISVGLQLDTAGQPVFFVRDNGAGFDMAHGEKLFLPFERLHAAAEFPGSGIGLATVSRVIGHHGGRLWADATPGSGATFYFTLPRQALMA